MVIIDVNEAQLQLIINKNLCSGHHNGSAPTRVPRSRRRGSQAQTRGSMRVRKILSEDRGCCSFRGAGEVGDFAPGQYI